MAVMPFFYDIIRTMKINVYVETQAMELNKPFTYLCNEQVYVGCRVKVPF